MENDNKTSVLDAVIVGGGPAGLNAALILGRACRRVVVIDSGLPRNRAAKKMNGFIGRDGTDPHRLLSDARAEIHRYGVQLVQDTVTDAAAVPDPAKYGVRAAFAVVTKSGREYVARKLLFATGMYDELPPLPGVEACHGTSVHHCPYCDGWEHRGEHLLSYGKDAKAAVGLALALRGWSSEVTVLTDGTQLSADERERLAANGIAWCEEKLVELVHDQGQLRGVRLEAAEMLPASALFFNTDQRPNCQLPLKLGCATDESGRTETSEKQKTAHPGVFVAGDASGNVQMVVVAAAEGATAALAINRELQDEDRID